jgi:uncharacterized protein (TIGR03067 family)
MIQSHLVFIELIGLRQRTDYAARAKRFCSLRGTTIMSLTKRLGMRTSSILSTLLAAVALTSLGLLAGVTPRALGDEKPQSELLKPFQGTWATDGDGIDAKWTFDGEKLKATVNGTDYSCKVKIDTEAKPNPTMDLTIEEGPEETKGKVSKVIYKLDGEKLTLCVSVPGKDRPKEFAQVEDESYLFALKKQK